MFLSLALAAMFSTPRGELVCSYDPDRNGNKIVLRSDGSVRFVGLEVSEKDSVMQADIYRKTAASLLYKIVMGGRTDIFRVSLKTLHGTQTLDYGPSEQPRSFHLVCER
jgi:hypothetical protein